MTQAAFTDWSELWMRGDTPWDLGRAHPELIARLQRGALAPSVDGTAFVPGCGSGFDAAALAAAGWRVIAIDIHAAVNPAPQAQILARGGRAVVGNAFEFGADERFDIIFEHTFFCAIEPGHRPAYTAMAHRSLRSGGRLCGVLSAIHRPTSLGGPPWGTCIRELRALLGSCFELREFTPVVENAMSRRQWPEAWISFEKICTDAMCRRGHVLDHSGSRSREVFGTRDDDDCDCRLLRHELRGRTPDQERDPAGGRHS